MEVIALWIIAVVCAIIADEVKSINRNLSESDND